MATPRTLGDALTLLKSLQTDVLKAQADAKAAKVAALRAVQRVDEIPSELGNDVL